MDYSQVSLFLEKFKRLLLQKEVSQTLISESLSKYIKIPITEKMFKVKGSIIYIQGSPIFRSEILINKESILSDLNKTIGSIRFTDIR